MSDLKQCSDYCETKTLSDFSLKENFYVFRFHANCKQSQIFNLEILSEMELSSFGQS